MTVSPASLPIALRRSALIGSLCVPLPMAMNALRNRWPSFVHRAPRSYSCSPTSSSSLLASWRSGCSNPSVNQP